MFAMRYAIIAEKLFVIRGATPPSCNGLLHGRGEASQASSGGQIAFAAHRQTFLPSVAVIAEGSYHDSSRMIALCAVLQAREIAIFDKGYAYFQHLFSLAGRGIFGSRGRKTTCSIMSVKRKVIGNILRDDESTLKVKKFEGHYRKRMRRIVTMVAVDGKMVV